MKCAKCGNTLATVICSKCGYSSKTDIWYLTQLSALELTIDINIQKTGYYYQKDKDNPVYVAPYSADFQVEEDRLVKYCGTSSYVRVPDGIRIIDKSAFAENKSIRTVTLPETVTEIREKAFYLCANLHSVVFPSKLEIIGDSAFAHSGFKTGTLPNSLKQLGAGVFSSTNMERVRVPSKVKVVPENAFRDCYFLREVELGEGVEKIATGAFNFCIRLRTIIIPNSLKQVELAFVGTAGISNVAASSEWKVKNVQIVKKMMPSFNEAELAAKANDKQNRKPYSALNTNALDKVQKKENVPKPETNTPVSSGLSADAMYQKGEELFYKARLEQDGSEIYKKAFDWYHKAAQLGHALAQCQLGIMYRFGWGVERLVVLAFHWCSKAAQEKQNCPRGKYLLGECYEYGIGVEKNEKEAVRWYRIAADEGYLQAQEELARCYRHGSGVEKDPVKAAYWLSKAEDSYTAAAEQGDIKAQEFLGEAYGDRWYLTFGKEDRERSFYWYRRAAEQGSALAQYAVGSCYLFSKGVRGTMFNAIPWYYKAAQQGYCRAIRTLEDIEKAGYDISLFVNKPVEKIPPKPIRKVY